MKNILVIIAATLIAFSVVYHAQTVPASQTASTPEEHLAAVANNAGDGLSDLEAMTFDCPKSALNTAAREAAKVPSQGTYQFAYFNIINDSHHSSYEIHFKSNYEGEPELKYCVSIYCQQGWDPKTAKTSVKLISNEYQHQGVAAHEADCHSKPAPVKRTLTK
jgi:hypothetical protein